MQQESTNSQNHCEYCGEPIPSLNLNGTPKRFCSGACVSGSRIKSDDDRFWSRVDRSGGPDACWLWIGRVMPAGYGALQSARPNKHWTAHRYSWTIANGEIPDGMCICHRCDVKLCVNPAHLFLGTVEDNVADRVSKWRTSCGETHHRATLTENQVREILRRFDSGEVTQIELAREHGVARDTIFNIVRRKTWKHLHR